MDSGVGVEEKEVEKNRGSMNKKRDNIFFCVMNPNLVLHALLQTCTVATRTYLIVVTGLSWPVAIVIMRHSSDGRP
jgi:hypothetical protein